MLVDHFTREEVSDAVSRIVNSATFRASDRNKRFLRYVVEETLSGRGRRIKSYNIAVDVLERSADFNAAADAIVRIQASRLRAALAKYYRTEGLADAIRIGMPLGSYAADIQRADPVCPALAEAPVASPAHRLISARSLPGWLRRFAAPLGVAMLVVVASAGLILHSWSSTQVAVRPTIVLALPQYAGDDAAGRGMARGLKEALLTALTRYEGLAVTAAADPQQVAAVVAGRGQLGGAVYVLDSSVGTGEGKLWFTWRLASAVDGLVLWSDRVEESLDSSLATNVEERIADGVARLVASGRGIVVQTEMRKARSRPVLGYECMLQAFGYIGAASLAQHAIARDCLEATVKATPNDAEIWALLAYMYVDEARCGFNMRGTKADAQARAQAASSRALELDPSSSLVQLVRSVVLFNGGDDVGFERAARRAIALNPGNPSRRALSAFRLFSLGRYEEGAAMAREGLELDPFPPAVFHLTTLLDSFRRDDCRAAVDEASGLTGDPGSYIIPLTLAAIHGKCGNKAAAAENVEKLLKWHPDYAQIFRSDWRNRRFREDFIDKVADGLRKAGLAVN